MVLGDAFVSFWTKSRSDATVLQTPSNPWLRRYRRRKSPSPKHLLRLHSCGDSPTGSSSRLRGGKNKAMEGQRQAFARSASARRQTRPSVVLGDLGARLEPGRASRPRHCTVTPARQVPPGPCVSSPEAARALSSAAVGFQRFGKVPSTVSMSRVSLRIKTKLSEVKSIKSQKTMIVDFGRNFHCGTAVRLTPEYFFPCFALIKSAISREIV